MKNTDSYSPPRWLTDALETTRHFATIDDLEKASEHTSDAFRAKCRAAALEVLHKKSGPLTARAASSLSPTPFGPVHETLHARADSNAKALHESGPNLRWWTGVGRTIGAVAAFVVLLVVGTIAIRQTIFAPVVPPSEETRKFERDLLTGEIPVVSASDFFSEKQRFGYEQHGDGFRLTFVIRHDPRANYSDTKFECVLPVETDRNFSKENRIQFVKARRKELEEKIKAFKAEIPLKRTLEIGVDDTEGVRDSLRTFVLSKLKDEKQRLVSDNDTTKVFLFRITNTDYSDADTWEVEPKTPLQDIERKFDSEVDGWLLADHGTKPISSVATGLFNNLKYNGDFRLRRILVFGYGMENHPKTVSLYKIRNDPDFLDRKHWSDIDKAISKFEPFPDLRFADVVWYFPPSDYIKYHLVHNYWSHVFADVTHAKSVNIVY